MAGAPPKPAPTLPGTLSLSLLFVVLGGWIGAMLFFAAVMAPSAFAVLGDPAQAGRLVGRTLATLNGFGGIAGVVLALLAWLQGRSPWLLGFPLLLTAMCIYSHFGVTGAMAEIQAVPDWRADPALSRRFTSLHELSVRLLGLTLLGALGLLVAHARALSSAWKAPKSLKNA